MNYHLIIEMLDHRIKTLEAIEDRGKYIDGRLDSLVSFKKAVEELTVKEIIKDVSKSEIVEQVAKKLNIPLTNIRCSKMEKNEDD